MVLYMQFTSLLYLTVLSAAMPPYGVVFLDIAVFKWQHQQELGEMQWSWVSMWATVPATDIPRGRVGNACGNSLVSKPFPVAFKPLPNFCL